MKRGFSTLALLCGTVIPLSAFAQAEAPAAPPEASPPTGQPGQPEQPPAAAPDAPTDAAAPGTTTTDPGTPAPGEAAPADAATAPAGEAAAPADAAAEQKPVASAPLPQGDEPEYEEDPKLDPEVYYEGDSDDHNPGYVPGYGGYRSIGLSPWSPRYGAMPGGLTAPAGSDTWDEEWVFSFHGYLESTLRAAYGAREVVAPGQSETVWHAQPIVPGRYGDFEATQSVPGPWVQMNFTYGNPYVSGTVILAGFNQQDGASYNYPSSQLGINDVYLTLKAPRMGKLNLKAHAGAFQDRYGAMAQYSEGNYGSSLIAYTRGTGATVIGDVDMFGGLVGVFEVGFKGSLDKAPNGDIVPSDANAYADAQNGAGYVGHAHAGVILGDVDISAHYLHAFSHDDRVPDFPQRPSPESPNDLIPSQRPDGTIDTYGLTLRAIGEPYGHFFAGVGYTKAVDSRNVPRVINILNAEGGRGLMEEYFGMLSGGNGDLLTTGFQYDMSLQKFLHSPAYFNGNDWDLRASFFGIYAHVNSDQKFSVLPGYRVNFDDVDKLKVGTELTYNFVSWMGVSCRYDYVGPDLGNSERSFQIISPKLLFHTSFLSHEQFSLRYTRWFYGDQVIIQTVAPNDIQGLDEQMIALQANMWW